MLLVCQIYHGVVPRPKNLSPKGFLNGLSNPLLIYKKAVTPKGVTAFSWRRARDSNPRTGYSPLHDFQEDSGSPKVVDIHRFSHSHIFVATAEIDILTTLVSGIYVTAVVVFPSSNIVSYCENIYPLKRLKHIQ